MRIYRLLLLFISLIAFNSYIFCQFYSAGQDPASTRWEQINTKQFTIVFPHENLSEAKVIAAVLEQSFQKVTQSFGHIPKPIQVIIHGKTAESNGFVTWAPRRMELYPTSPQSVYPQPWLEQLALHELRHVVQIDAARTGFTKFMSYLLGEQATGAVAGGYFPLWLLEGDATLTETLNSLAGRGRMPWFEQQLRAQLIEKGKFTYNKAYFGSYRDYVPNYYVMGYYLTLGANARYGLDFWGNVMKKTAQNSYYPWMFSRAIKNKTGLRKTRLYQSVFDSLKRDWKNDFDSHAYSNFTNLITLNKKDYKSYLFLRPLDSTTIVAELTGPGEDGKIVSIDNMGNQSLIKRIGRRDEEPLSVVNNTIAWSEYESDLRWEHAVKSVVKILDVKTGVLKKINYSPRLFAPSLSPNAKQLAILNFEQHYPSIDIYDIESKLVAKTFSSNDQMILSPCWDENGENLIAIRLNEKGKKISHLNLKTGQWFDLTSESFTEIRYPFNKGNNTYFAGSYNGIENIYRINNQSLKTEKLTSAPFGATAPSIWNDSVLIYSNYSSLGYAPVKVSIANLNPEMLDKQLLSKPIWLDSPQLHQLKPIEYNFTDTAMYQQKKYSKWNLLNLHSWAPAYVNIDNQEVQSGISLFSQNLLSTLSLQAGYNGDKNKTDEKYFIKLNYLGWRPRLSLSISLGDTQVQKGLFRDNIDTFYVDQKITLQDFKVKPGLEIPFNLSRGAWQRLVQISLNYQYLYHQGYSTEATKYTITNNQWALQNTVSKTYHAVNFQNLEYDFFAYNLLKGNSRDIMTRWGQVLELNYRHTPWGTRNLGSVASIITRLYFPGILKHHAIKIENNYQYKTNGDVIPSSSLSLPYQFSNVVSFARGYYPNQFNNQLYSLKVDYALPLINPDLSIGGVLYMKQIYAKLFYDYARSTLNPIKTNNLISIMQQNREYQSTGIELMTESHFARFVFPYKLGIRYSYMPTENAQLVEFLYQMNFGGFLSKRN